MIEGADSEWFLEIEGRRTGPFATDQILGLLEDGEIPDTQKIYASTLATEFITVRTLFDRFHSLGEPAIETPEPTKSFIPPPRPADLQPSGDNPRAAPQPTVTSLPPTSGKTPTAKPEIGLLDALMAARERKAHSTRAMPPEASEAATNPFSLKNIPITRRTASTLGAAVFLIFAIWAFWSLAHFIQQKSGNVVTTSSQQDPAKPGSAELAPPSAFPAAVPAGAPAIVQPAHAPAPPPRITSAGAATTNPRDIEKEAEREREREANTRIDAVYPPPQPPAPPSYPTPNEGNGLIPPPPLPIEAPIPHDGVGNPSANGEAPPPPPPPLPIE